ncbi:protein of unknown function [Paraburkholderia kururiensis]
MTDQLPVIPEQVRGCLWPLTIFDKDGARCIGRRAIGTHGPFAGKGGRRLGLPRSPMR